MGNIPRWLLVSINVLCLALTPLTTILINKEQGKKSKEKTKTVIHVLWMTLSCFSRDETELQQELTTVKTYTDDIQMESSLDKCATAVFKQG